MISLPNCQFKSFEFGDFFGIRRICPLLAGLIDIKLDAMDNIVDIVRGCLSAGWGGHRELVHDGGNWDKPEAVLTG